MSLIGPHPPASTQRPRLLAVFAHPDDEVFCAGGALAQWASVGGETMVLSATRGEAGQIHDVHAATRRTLGDVRERELHLACGHLGVRHVECLGYRDGTLQVVGQGILAHDVSQRIHAFKPDVVITFGPDGGYGHPDHCAISTATTRACQLVARTDAQAPRLYYSAFPRQHRLLCQWLAHWLLPHGSSFQASPDFVHALALLAEEATLLGYADDTTEVRWFPTGFSIVEQGEPGSSLYLIVSGHAQIVQEEADGAQRVLGELGSGQFFGEEALARQRPQAASFVATSTVTCLVLSPRRSTPFDGRGSGARVDSTPMTICGNDQSLARSLTRIDISPWLDRKIAALAAHRTQFRMEPSVLPAALLEELLGREYFVPVAVEAACMMSADTRGATIETMQEHSERLAIAAST